MFCFVDNGNSFEFHSNWCEWSCTGCKSIYENAELHDLSNIPSLQIFRCDCFLTNISDCAHWLKSPYLDVRVLAYSCKHVLHFQASHQWSASTHGSSIGRFSVPSTLARSKSFSSWLEFTGGGIILATLIRQPRKAASNLKIRLPRLHWLCLSDWPVIKVARSPLSFSDCWFIGWPQVLT